MANQIIIDIGAVANDGTGDPLRTAFNYVNNNFSNIWATGVANSNIAFSGNKILTTNTNGNLVLAPNGIGKVQANVDIIPNANNTLSLGSLTNKWNTVYTQYLEIGGTLTTGDLTVDGNLTVTGNTIQIGNIVTDTKTIQLANTASTGNAANGSGITVGANDNIATLLYDNPFNAWKTENNLITTANVNSGNLNTTGQIFASGNVIGSQFFGAGASFTGNVNTTNNISGANISANNISFTNNLFGKTATFTGDTTGDNSLYAGVQLFTSLGSDVIAQFSGNVDTYVQFNFQNGNSGPQASGDYVITADNGNDVSHFLNLGMTSSTWNGTQPNSLGNRLGPNDGYLYVQDGDMVIGTSNGNIETWKFGQDGTLTVSGDIVPTANNTQTLGTNTNRWSNLYLSGNTIYLGDLSLSAGVDGLTSSQGFDLANSTAANIEATGNITANYFLGNVEGLIGNITNLDSVNFAVENIGALIGNNGVNIGAGGNNNLVVLPDEVLIQNVPLTVAGNILSTVAGGLNITANTVANGVAQTWNFGTDGDLTVPGNIVSGNARISLQEPSFDSVYITPVTDDTTSITLDPSGIALNSAVGMTVSANTAGNVIAWSFNDEGAFGLPYGGTLDNNSENDVELRSTNNVNFEANAVVNIYTDTNGTAYQWQFGIDGNLTLPAGGSIIVDGGDGVIGPDSDNLIISWDNEELILRSVGGDVDVEADRDFNIRVNYDGGANDYLTKWVFGQDNEIVNITGNSAIVTEAGNLNLQGGRNTLSSGNVQITAVDNGVAVNTWTFDNTGNLNLPVDGNLVGITSDNSGFIAWAGNSSGDGLGYTTMGLIPDETLVNSDQYLILDPTAPGHIHIRAGGTQDNSSADLFLGGENSYFRVASGANAAASVSANSYVWTYGTDGTFSLPAAESPGQYSEITSVGNSSGDGNGYATLQLKPDSNVGGDSYLIIDPTAPNHIHIRAGGAQDNSGAQLFLGGENSYFMVENGENPNVYVQSNSNQWKFDTTGVLNLPGEGVLQSFNDTVTLSSLNTTTGNANSVYLGSSGGLGFNDQEIGGNWLEIFRSGSDPEIRVPVGRGNLNIQTAEGANVYNWTFDNTGNIQGNISLTGANIIINNAPGGAEGAELKWALPAVANTSLSGTVVQDVYASGMRFFESGGNSRGLTMDLGNAPNGTATAVGYRDIPQITLGANVTANATNAGRHFYSTTAGNLQITLPDNANVAFPLGATLTVVVNAAGNVIVAQGTGVSLYMAGSSSTGNRTVGAYGLASVMKVATDTWVISGTGVY